MSLIAVRNELMLSDVEKKRSDFHFFFSEDVKYEPIMKYKCVLDESSENEAQ